jgi:hypothetical protein
MLNLMTKLDAVNKMLEAVWETPVSTLEVAGVGSVAMAKRILDETLTAVLLKGWAFNTERLTLQPALGGELFLPQNVLEVDSCEADKDRDVVQRGYQVYDRENNTYIFGKPLRVEIKFLFEFELIPQAARTYIAVLASRVFKAKYENSDLGTPTEEEVLALSALQNAEGETLDANMFTDSYSVASILCR